MYKIINLNIVYHLILLLSITQYSYAQHENQSWIKTSFEKKMPHNFRLELAQGLRLKDHISNFSLAFFEGALSYKNSKGLKISLPYRYTILQDKIKHRLSFGLSHQYLLKMISLKYRLKYYRLYENGEMKSEDGNAFGNLIRNKLTIRYKTKGKVNPYISGELIYLYNTYNNPFNEYRASLGFEIDLPNKNSINLFYIFKKEGIAKSNPNEINIIGLSYISKI